MDDRRPRRSAQFQSTKNALVNAPWRQTRLHNAQSPKLNLEADTYAAVDPRRSRKNDQNEAQDGAGFLSSLSPEASPFVPASQASAPVTRHYTPYQPLRVSTGINEKAIVLAATKEPGKLSNPKSTNVKLPAEIKNKDDRKHAKLIPKVEDQPVASIESSEPVQHLAVARLIEGRVRETTKSPTPPSATELYKAQAKLPQQRREAPQKLLVILDLNGTLLYRSKSNKTTFHMRPGVGVLLEYLFENHVVMVYTSAMPVNCEAMVHKFLHPNLRKQLAAVWARDKLDLNQKQFFGKVQVYKKLSKVWADPEIQKKAPQGVTWNQTNTILIDDSQLKGLSEPHNLVQVPEYTKDDAPKTPQDSEKANVQLQIMRQLAMKLEELKWQADVSALIRAWQTGEQEVPRVPGQQLVVEETIDQKTDVVKQVESLGSGTPDLQEREAVSKSKALSSCLTKTSESRTSLPAESCKPRPVIPGLELLAQEDNHAENHVTRQVTIERESSIDEDDFKDILRA